MKRSPILAGVAAGLLLITLRAQAADPHDHAGHSHPAPAAQSAPTKPVAPVTKTAEPQAVTDSLVLLERAVAKDSTRFDLLYRLGGMYIDRDRATQAVQVLHRALREKPDHVGTVVNLGAAYDALPDPETAQGYYRRALELAPGDAIASCRLASSLYAQGQYTAAMALMREVIAAHPRAHCAYFTLGVAFADAGIYRDAIRMWKKVVELAPDTPEGINARESAEVLEKFIGKTP